MSWTFFFHYASVRQRDGTRSVTSARSSAESETWKGAKYPSAVLIIPQSQLDDLGCKAVGLLFRITWGHRSKDQNALAYGGNQLLFHRDRCREHSLKYGCE